MTMILPFVMEKHRSDLTLLNIYKQHPFSSVSHCYFFLCLVVSWINQITFHYNFILNLIPMLIFALYFVWRLIYTLLNQSGKKSDWSQVSALLGNNREHMLVCAEMISSLVRKVSSIAKAHMSLGILWGAAVLLWQLVFPWYPSCRHMTWPEF